MTISCDTAVIGYDGDDIYRGVNSGYCYVYTKIGGKWIGSGKIVPEYGAAGDNFGYSVDLSGSTALFGAPFVGEVNCGSSHRW